MKKTSIGIGESPSTHRHAEQPLILADHRGVQHRKLGTLGVAGWPSGVDHPSTAFSGIRLNYDDVEIGEVDMRSAVFVLLVLVAVGILPRDGACQTSAEYGAVVMDEAHHRAVFSYNDPSPAAADNEALRSCGRAGCKLAFRFGPNSCAAIAMPDNSGIWGGAVRRTTQLAEVAALENCQKRTQERCKVRKAVCNGQPATTASHQYSSSGTSGNNASIPSGGYIGKRFGPNGIQKWWCPQPAFSPLNCKYLGPSGVWVNNPFNR
jgi:Domain of unknown function (DUF4189)